MTAGSIRAVLRLRTLGPSGLNPPQTEVVDRLRTLVEADPIADLDVDVWGSGMGDTRTGDRDPLDVRESVAEFERWADQEGCSLRPAFERRFADSADDEEGRSGRIVTPLITLAVYEGERLRAVHPHVNGGEVRTIHDGVGALESMLRDVDRSNEERGENLATPI